MLHTQTILISIKVSPIIETETLILREFIMDDYKEVYEFGSNDEVQKFTGDKLIGSLDEAKDLIKNVWFEDYNKYGYGRWATIYKLDQKLIGFAGLKYLSEFNETDIGFRFLPSYWGKGIATEASKEIIKYGFEKLQINRIIGIAMPENIGSCRVLEKIGLTLYKRAEYDEGGKVCNWYKIDNPIYQ